MKTFPITQLVKKPVVIIADKNINPVGIKYIHREDVMHLVMPYSWREVFALQLLEHQVEKFAPAIGNGVLITDAAHKKLNA